MSVYVDILSARDGNEIIQVKKDDVAYILNSTYRPMQEAEKYAKQFEQLEEGSILFVFGFGNGMFPQAILDVIPKTVQCVFYEPCKEIVDVMKDKMDFVSFCKKYKCKLVAAGIEGDGNVVFSKEQFPNVVEQTVHYNDMDHLKFAILTKYNVIFEDDYLFFTNKIKEHLCLIQIEKNTRQNLGHKVLTNNLNNIQYMLEGYAGDDIIHQIPEDYPAIVVSAGPSLDHNISMLKKAKGKAFILCVDTAIKRLLKEDIIPDAIACIDMRKELALFDDPLINGIPIIVDPDVSTEVLSMLPLSKKIFVGTRNEYLGNMYKRFGKSMEEIKSGGSVSTMAFAVCVRWGFKNIILVGQDLAMTNNTLRAGDESIDLQNSGMELLPVKGVNGDVVYTRMDYYSYLKWLENEIALHSDISVIDATEGGALIEGTKVMTLESALEEYTSGERSWSLMHDYPTAFLEEQKEILRKEYKKDVCELDSFIDLLKTGMEDAKKANELMLKNDSASTYECRKIINKLNSIVSQYDSLRLHFFLHEEMMNTNLDTYLSIRNRWQSIEESEKVIVLQEYFTCILQAALAIRRDIYE